MRELSTLQRLMLELEVVLTGKTPDEVIHQYHHYPLTVLSWIEKSHGGSSPVWYLCDGGYSRLCWNPYDKDIFLTYQSRAAVVAKWEEALPQRQSLLDYLNAEFERLRALT